MADSCEHGNEPSGSIKCDELLVQLSDYQLLKYNPAAPNIKFLRSSL